MMRHIKELIKELAVGLSVVIALLFVTWILAQTVHHGRVGHGTIIRVPFEGVNPADTNRLSIAFEGAELVDMLGLRFKGKVWVKPEKQGENRITVQTDPGSSATRLSATPTLKSRLIGGEYFVAERVEIFVSTEEERALWEKWIKESEMAYFKRKDSEGLPAPRKIIPKV